MQLINKLNLLIDNRHLLKHDFYQAWSRGELNISILQQYAKQYYFIVDTTPRLISTLHSECSNKDVRKGLLKNLCDEELNGIDHATLWLNFAEGLGVKAEEVANEKPLPETQAMVDTLFNIARRDWRDGLCAFYAYERQIPDVSLSKMNGLKEFYGINDERTIKWFKDHYEYDIEHSREVGNLIMQHSQSESALQATQESLEAQWKFLDGMCRISGIVCH